MFEKIRLLWPHLEIFISTSPNSTHKEDVCTGHCGQIYSKDTGKMLLKLLTDNYITTEVCEFSGVSNFYILLDTPVSISHTTCICQTSSSTTIILPSIPSNLERHLSNTPDPSWSTLHYGNDGHGQLPLVSWSLQKHPQQIWFLLRTIVRTFFEGSLDSIISVLVLVFCSAPFSWKIYVMLMCKVTADTMPLSACGLY